MWLGREQRLPSSWTRAWTWTWTWAWLLWAHIATATTTSSNSSTAPAFSPLPLTHANGDHAQIARLLPLTHAAVRRQIQANLYNTNISTVANISAGDIAYISCNPDDYSGFIGAQSVFEDAYRNANISAVILYSTASDYCNYAQSNSQDMMQKFPILTMTNKTDSTTLRAAVSNLPASASYMVVIQGRDDGTTNSTSITGGNPLGPSPSTAVAMIILYSITGIITALFLVIIVTGAIRAHRHPERYGPRDVLGRPRQSRARGLGRAILDTLPIVKFGEKDPDKPSDVELGSVVETRDANEASADNPAQTSQKSSSEGEPIETASVNIAGAAQTSLEEHQEGIAPAQAPAASAALGENNTFHEESLGCSICTEDFEKGQDLRVLPCDHKFHPECVDPWLLNVSGTCPLCRVDLRPITSRDSNDLQNPDDLAPPINPEAETSHRRRTAFLDILSLRHRPNASTEERISALRRLREQHRDRSQDRSANASSEDVVSRNRRSQRLSVRLSGVFGGRTRRERRDESPGQQAEPRAIPLEHSPSRNESPAPAAEHDINGS